MSHDLEAGWQPAILRRTAVPAEHGAGARVVRNVPYHGRRVLVRRCEGTRVRWRCAPAFVVELAQRDAAALLGFDPWPDVVVLCEHQVLID